VGNPFSRVLRWRSIRKYGVHIAVLVTAGALGIVSAVALAEGVGYPGCAPGSQEATGVSDDGTVTVGGLTFTFTPTGQGTASFTVSGGSFTGVIYVKGGEPHNPNFFENATSGNVSSAINPANQKPFGISHIDICVTSSTTTTETTTGETTTTTTGETTSTTTQTTTGTTTGETTGTTTDQTTTQTTTGTTTGEVTGTTTILTTSTTTGTEVGTTTGTTTSEIGGQAGEQGGGGGPAGGGGGQPAGGVAGAQAKGGGPSELAFTGLGVPLLALLGVGMMSLGALARRKLNR
jgi:hypothetical protein